MTTPASHPESVSSEDTGPELIGRTRKTVTAPEATFDSRRFRRVLEHFATGIAVITAMAPSGPAGMVVSSFTSVSLEPPLVAFLPDKSSTSWPKIRAARAFCVNILSAGQEDLCAQFARKSIDKFAGVSWREASTGAPILDGGMAWIDCELAQTFESGDHYIAIGRVLQLEAAEYGVPLVFFQGGYGHFEFPPALDPCPRPAAPESAEDLVDEVIGRYVREFHDECIAIARRPASAVQALGDLLRAAFGSMEDNRVAIMILQNERRHLAARPEFGYLEDLERAIDKVWLATLQRGVDDGDFRADLDVKLVYEFIGDVLFMAARRYRPGRSAGHAHSAEIVGTYRSLILSGLLSQPRRLA